MLLLPASAARNSSSMLQSSSGLIACVDMPVGAKLDLGSIIGNQIDTTVLEVLNFGDCLADKGLEVGVFYDGHASIVPQRQGPVKLESKTGPLRCLRSRTRLLEKPSDAQEVLRATFALFRAPPTAVVRIRIACNNSCECLSNYP